MLLRFLLRLSPFLDCFTRRVCTSSESSSNTTEGKHAGLLLQGDKDNYRAILVALQSVSGVAVAVADKDREFVPVGVTTNVIKQSEPAQATEEKAPAVSTKEANTGLINLVSTPNGVDVYVDGQFVGNSPAELKLNLGSHVISAKLPGYKDWQRDITVAGGAVNLNATLVVAANSSPGAPLASTITAIEPAPVAVPRIETVTKTDGSRASGWIGVATNGAGTNVVITRVAADSAAAHAGLQVGDTILELNGAPVKSGEEFDVAISHFKPGSQIRVGYIRGAWKSEVTLTVGKIVPSGVQAVIPVMNNGQETKPVPDSTKNTAGVGTAMAQDTKNITCSSYEVSAYLWPDENMQGRDLGTIPCGEPVTMLSGLSKNVAQTIKVRTKEGKEGYVTGRFLGLASASSQPNNKAAKFDKRVKIVCSKHIGWSEAQCAAVAQHRVLIGMTGEMVIAAWGRPSTINRQILAGVVQDQWVLGHDSLDIPYQGKNYHMWGEEWSYVYLQNGIVTAIQTQPVHPF